MTEALVSGFQDLSQLTWFQEPPDWEVKDGNLVVRPPSKGDFWRKTYYEPTLLADHGSFLAATLPSDHHYTVETEFVLKAKRQFDQAGLIVRMDGEHWLKTGIEVVDGSPRLACVVTNVYSDWSTQSWSQYDKADSGMSVTARLRLHCRGSSFVVEAKFGEDWEFIRIAHLHPGVIYPDDPIPNGTLGPAAPEGKFWVGMFACCPEQQDGCEVSFSDFSILPGSHMEHNADGNHA